MPIKLTNRVKIIIGVVVAAIIFFALISAGYYPIMIVNNRLINSREFNLNYEAGYNYYQKALKIYSPNATTSLDLNKFQAVILSGLVDNVLIDQEARKELDGNFDLVLQNKLSELKEKSDFQKQVIEIYGISYEGFREEVLIPMAEKEVLTGRLFLKGQKIDDWLAGARKSARVIVISPRFYWDGSEIKTK